MKKCFGCKWRLPIWMFQKDKMKYQRPHDKGRVKCCRICNYSKWKRDGNAWLFNFDIKKFEKVIFTNQWQIIKKAIA